jgi:coenzyme F420-reducing hydrogenase beta subunit
VIETGKKEECSGCLACVEVCPVGAIRKNYDNYGFLCVEIDKEKCINCGLCDKTCGFRNLSRLMGRNKGFNKKAFVAVNRDNDELKKSASGGAFAAIAKNFIKNGGIVVGCGIDIENGKANIRHIIVDKERDLHLLQGSKYSQSDMGDIYKTLKEKLEGGQNILFSGTPCQIAGLYGYLKKEYPNLYTIDLACHGIASVSLLEEYIKYLQEEVLHGGVTEIIFRDKQYGNGFFQRVKYKKGNKVKSKSIPPYSHAYWYLIQNSLCLRESCYNCEFADENRIGDITIGDYWGFKKVHPELTQIDASKGVSFIFMNNDKGKYLIENSLADLTLFDSTVEKVLYQGKALKECATATSERNYVLDMWENSGYKALEKYFKKRMGLAYYEVTVKSWLVRLHI